MAGQPFVAALSICGPAVAKSSGYEAKNCYLDAGESRKITNQDSPPFRRHPNSNAVSSSKENIAVDTKTLATSQAIRERPREFTTSTPNVAPRNFAKKSGGPVVSKPPFLVGKAPIRNLVPQKPAAVNVNVDNRAEISDLKKQIAELSNLLRQHVKAEIEKRDVGTDPMVFGNVTDRGTNTDRKRMVCSSCKENFVTAATPSPVQGDSEEDNVGLCSQLESLAMQYLSDDQLANIASGKGIHPSSGNKEEHLESLALRYLSDDVFPDPIRSGRRDADARNEIRPFYHQRPCSPVHKSPPKRRMAAITATTESNVFSPNFGDGGMTVTRRQCVMKMEQQVSVFDGRSRDNGVSPLPFGVSVASQDFINRHGVMKTTRSPIRQNKYVGGRDKPDDRFGLPARSLRDEYQNALPPRMEAYRPRTNYQHHRDQGDYFDH